MTERTVWLEVPDPLFLESERQVSVPWCIVHDSPQAITDERSYPFCVESAHVQYSELINPIGAEVGECVIEVGVVWKVADDADRR